MFSNRVIEALIARDYPPPRRFVLCRYRLYPARQIPPIKYQEPWTVCPFRKAVDKCVESINSMLCDNKVTTIPHAVCIIYYYQSVYLRMYLFSNLDQIPFTIFTS